MLEKGFTLIEVMVAVSIVAVLTTLSLIAYSGVQKNGRDAKRQADLKVIQSALEQYHNDQGSYPPFITPVVGVVYPNPTATPTLNYLANYPKDPQPAVAGADYCYQGINCDNGACPQYAIYTNLEKMTVIGPIPSATPTQIPTPTLTPTPTVTPTITPTPTPISGYYGFDNSCNFIWHGDYVYVLTNQIFLCPLVGYSSSPRFSGYNSTASISCSGRTWYKRSPQDQSGTLVNCYYGTNN